TGTITSTSSGVLDNQTVTWAARTEAPGGKTSPEELAAAAHSSCFAMAFNATLGEENLKAEKVVVSSTVTLAEVDGKPTIVSSAITLKATLPGVDEAKFRSIVDAAAALCPVSRLFAGATITVDASLDN